MLSRNRVEILKCLFVIVFVCICGPTPFAGNATTCHADNYTAPDNHDHQHRSSYSRALDQRAVDHRYGNNNSHSHLNVTPYGLTIGRQDLASGTGFSVTIPFSNPGNFNYQAPSPYQTGTSGFRNYSTHRFYNGLPPHGTQNGYPYPGSVYDGAFGQYGFDNYRSPYFNDPLQPQTAREYTYALESRNFQLSSSTPFRDYESMIDFTAPSLIPTSTGARRNQLIAEAAFRAGDYLEAAMRSNEALVIDKDNGMLMLFASQANFAAGYFANAVNELQNAALLLDDNQLAFIVNNYQQFYGRDDYVGQMDRLNEHLERNPRDHWALTLRGFQFGALGYAGVASDDFANAQRVNPDFDLPLKLDRVFGTGKLRPVIRVYTPAQEFESAPDYQPLPLPIAPESLDPEVEELPPPREQGRAFPGFMESPSAPPIIAPAGTSPGP
ncbi:MAG: hypothetical protein AAF456_11665 [Planctomycetota bacterium]